jgi:O-antigen ligase
MLVVMKASRGDASESSRERLECLYEGMTMWRSSPVLGVGMGQFTEYHFLTAHNSYVLTVAEVGIVGMFLWLGVIYMSVKPLLIGFFRYSKRSDSQIAAYWAMALLASMAGMLVGIFFLSFSYHVVLWVYWGLCGAFYTAVKKHDPDFKVRFGLIDLGLLATLTVGISVGLFVFTRLRPPGS